MKETGRADKSHAPDPETWVDEYGDYLYRYALARLRDTAAAEELVQETFLAALHSRKNFRGHSSMRTWLTGILKHKVVDHFRKQSREQRTEDIETSADLLDSLFDETGHWKTGPTEWSASPEELVGKKEFWEVFYQCLSELSNRSGKVFALREIDGLGTEDICKVFNISPTNCWVILHRSRMSMRNCLESNGFGADPLKNL